MSKQPNHRKSPNLAAQLLTRRPPSPQVENPTVVRRSHLTGNVTSNGTRRPSGTRTSSNASMSMDEASHYRHESESVRRSAPVVDDVLGADPGLQQIVAEQKRQSAQQRTEWTRSRHNRSFTGPSTFDNPEFSAISPGSVTTSPQTTAADENGFIHNGCMSPTKPDSGSSRNFSYQMPGPTTATSIKPASFSNNNLNIVSIPQELIHLSEAEIDLIMIKLSHLKTLKQQGITAPFSAPDPTIELKRQLSYASTSTLSTITMDETLANLSLNHKQHLKSKSRGYLDAEFDEELSLLSGGETNDNRVLASRDTRDHLREGAFNSNFYRNQTSPTHNIPPVIFDTVNDATSVVSDRSETIKIPSIRQKGILVNSKDVTSDEGSTVTHLTMDRNFIVKDTDSIASNASNHSSSKRFSISRRTAFDDRSNCSGVSSLSNNSGHNLADSQYLHGSNASQGMYTIHQYPHGSTGGISSMHLHKDTTTSKQNISINGSKRLSPKRVPATDTNVINGIMYVNVHGGGNINMQPADSTKLRTKLSSSTKSKKM